MALSDPQTHRDQWQVLEDRSREDACVTIEQRPETHRQSDRHNDLDADEPMSSADNYLTLEVGCPTFTHELRQVR